MLGACFRWWPHVVMLVSAFFTPPFVLEVIRARGMKVVMLFTESPYQDGQQLQMAGYADVALLNDPVSLDAYREVCKIAEYAPHSYRPSVHYPAKPGTRKDRDLVFAGTGFPSRVEFLERMNLGGLAVALGGFWSGLAADSPLRGCLVSGDDDECIGNTETAALYRRSRTGLNLYRREAEDGWDGVASAIGPREVELAACGTWFARDPRPESDELFGMLPAFTGPEEAGDMIRWALAHPRKRHEAAARAREAVSGRTFTSAARRLLKLLDNTKG